MKFIVCHSQNIRDTGCFDADDNEIFGYDKARAEIIAYKNCAVPAQATGVYRFAGIVECESLHEVFEKSQNLTAEGWAEGQRSTMVGDLILGVDENYAYIENQAFVVEPFGFCQFMGA